MSPGASLRALPPGSSPGILRRGRLAALSLAATLYLLLALTVPGAFLIAHNAAGEVDDARAVFDGRGFQAAGTQHETAKAGGERHAPENLPGAKRLRALIESAKGAAKVFVAVLFSEAPALRLESPDAGYGAVLVERDLQPLTLPPQFLQRPPPAK